MSFSVLCESLFKCLIVTERGGLFIDAAVKDSIWFILDHIKDFKAVMLERDE
jgi:hypothetical protein